MVDQSAERYVQQPDGAGGQVIGQWRSLGPTLIGEGLGATGRVMCLAVHPADGSTIYAGSLSTTRSQPGGCGVWKTRDGGNTWRPIADNLPSLQVGDIAIDPTSPSRVYAATLNQQRAGNGLYRSENGGSSWTRISSDQRLNGRILLVDPESPTILYMAGVEAVYRSSDGGVSWDPVLEDGDGQITDLVMDRSNPKRLYAGMFGPDGSSVGGVYRTQDSGASWDRLTGCPGQRLPDASTGSTIRLATSVGRVYAGFKTSSDWTLYRTTGVGCSIGGRSEQAWERGWQAGAEVAPTIWSFLYADPVDPDFVYATGTNFRVSTDGGKNFSVVSGPHVDHHAFVTDPNNPAIIYTGCDGGIYKSSNHGASGSWTFIGEGISNTEFYDLADAATDPNLLIGGTQDNGTIRYGGTGTVWEWIRDGDGAGVEIDPTDDRTLYGVGQYPASIARSKDGDDFKDIAKGLPIGTDCFDMPFHLHSTIPTTLLASCGALWRTTSSAPPGDWRKIFEPGAGKVVRSVVDPATDVYYAGTSQGELFAGASGAGWTRVFSYAEALPGAGHPNVTDIRFDPDSTAVMFVTFDTAGTGRIFRINVSASPVNGPDITSDLPVGLRLRTVAVDRMNPFSLFVGIVQGGVYHGTSNDKGTSWRWRPYNDGLPAAVDVRRLLAHPTTGVLRAGTFGRGAFEVDTDWPLGSVLAAEGTVSELRAHDQGTMFGPPTDQIDVEVVFRLHSDPRKAFGLQLRSDGKEPAHRGMLDLLRDAFRNNGRVRVDYTRTGIRNGLAIRVIRIS
jgi:hypothetical protein